MNSNTIATPEIRKVFNKFGIRTNSCVLKKVEEWEWVMVGEWISQNKKELMLEFVKLWETFTNKVAKVEESELNSIRISELLSCNHYNFCKFIEHNFKESEDIKFNGRGEYKVIRFTERGAVEVLVKYRNTDLEFIENLIGRRIIG